MAAFRTETDPLGKKKVPAKARYGIHTQRSKENFQVSGKTLPLELFHAIAEIKIATALANKELRLLDAKRCSAICRAAKEVVQGKLDSDLIVDAFQAGAGTPTHMNVNEVIANRAIELLRGRKGNYSLVHPNDHVNMGQSTNNVVPTALKLVSLRKAKELVFALKELQKSLLKKSREFRSLIKSGRTHLQDAVPITLGQEFHAYASSIGKAAEIVEHSARELRSVNMGRNAVGTGINTLPSFSKKIVKHLRKISKLPLSLSDDPIYATQNVTLFLHLSDSLRIAAIDIIKMGNDLRLLSSGPHTGFGELSLPVIEPGSSIMPGKVNPALPEMITMVGYQILGNNEVISQACEGGQLELNVWTPVIAKNLIESFDLLINSLTIFTKKCIKGIKANKTVLQHHFENSGGLATLLNPYIGYEEAATLAQESNRTGKSIIDIVTAKGLMTRKEIEHILHYRHVTSPNLKKHK